MRVYVSHTGINNWEKSFDTVKSTLKEVVEEMNETDSFKKIYNTIFEGNSLSSSTRIFANVEVVEEQDGKYFKFYEKQGTKELQSANDSIAQYENILISCFDAESLLKILNDSMTSNDVLQLFDENGQEANRESKPMFQSVDYDMDVAHQSLFDFKDGEVTLESLKYEKNEEPLIVYSDGEIDKNKSKLLPEDLTTAIRSSWSLGENEGKLRLFQEDSLFFISEKLLNTRSDNEKQLLLSMPTGGGKTEAFMIPVLASAYHKKKNETEARVKSIIIYPTNALANDQAMRFVDMIYKVNSRLSEQGVPTDKLISIGILSKDTPGKYADLRKESLIKICPSCGKTDWLYDHNTLVCQNPVCGENLGFCRLTKDDILDNPPDILITNPDEINACLHSPLRSKIFYSKIDSIVFDEVHVYQGIFGCHVAHLLRRLEDISNHKPLYIGMSATIKNAKELAALLFNENLEDIKYINDNENKYTDPANEVKKRLHVLLKPALISNKQGTKKFVRSMSVAGIVGIFIGHLLTDSHFRKSIIFTNYRAEADDLAAYLGHREKLDIKEMLSKILYKANHRQSLSQEEIEICQYMYKWVNNIYSSTKTVVPQISIGWNRGGLEKDARIRSIHSFSKNSLLGDGADKYPIDLMVATKSLEVGIDIGDVTTVINASAPYTANEYVQRVGRGGRKKDSMAITVVNSENAIDAYFKKHFKEYVAAKNDVFEEAPIILNNDIIIKRHLQARLVDYIVKKLVIEYGIKSVVKVRHLVENFKVINDGKILSVGPGKTSEDIYCLAKVIYEEIFERERNGSKGFDLFEKFLTNETLILNTKLACPSREEIIQTFVEMLGELNNHIQPSSRPKWEMDEILVGFNGLWKDYTPGLRGNGASVDLYIHGAKEDAPTDTVSRQTAFNQMPPATNAKQVVTIHSGISTFKIDGIHGDTDRKTQTEIRKILRKNESARNYFYNKIDDFPYPDDPDFTDNISVTVPLALDVSYFPSRFYCPSCKRGLVQGSDFNEVKIEKDGIYCNYCKQKVVEQLHQVYFCPDCGGVFDPPVPKVCINPDCRDYQTFYRNLTTHRRLSQDMWNHFKFRLTKDMEWECETCHCKLNYHSTQRLILNNKKHSGFVNNVAKKWQRSDSPEGTAIKYKILPELFSSSTNGRNRESVFTCQHDRSHKKIDSIGVPRVRTLSFNYVDNFNEEPLIPDINNGICDISFREGFVMQLAAQFMRRYTSGSYGNQINHIKMFDIFNQQQGFDCLGNYYRSHLAWIKFTDKLDAFIGEKKHSCSGNCSECTLFEENKLDLGDNMKPKLELEAYNYDSTTGTIKKPDFRSKFCERAANGECTELVCSECTHLDKDKYLRYLLVHTLKHSLLWAMPKYAGVNIADIKGEIYPNDGQAGADIVFIDNNEGGSGAIILIQRHWDEIWKFAQEIIEMTCSNDANILLHHNCFRNNNDLCPYIVSDFFKYLCE